MATYSDKMYSDGKKGASNCESENSSQDFVRAEEFSNSKQIINDN